MAGRAGHFGHKEMCNCDISQWSRAHRASRHWDSRLTQVKVPPVLGEGLAVVWRGSTAWP